MSHTLCLLAHNLPGENDPLPAPLVVATITNDRRVMRGINPEKRLRTLAALLGLLDFEITTTQDLEVPGHQLMLPFTR